MRPARVLVLDFGDPLRPGITLLLPVLKSGLGDRLQRPVEFLVENAPSSKSTDSLFIGAMTRWWATKYDLTSVDAFTVIGVTDPNTVRWLRAAFPTTLPITYYARGVLAGRISASADSLPNVFGVSNGDVVADGLPLIWQLLPATRHVVAIVDVPAEVGRLDSLIRREAPAGTGVQVLLRPTMEDLVALSDSLPEGAVFHYGGISADRTGRAWIPAAFVDSFAPLVAQPVFVTTLEHVTRGVLGGLVYDSKKNGAALAERISGTIDGSITDTASVFVIRRQTSVWRDWSLEEFGLPRSRLPANSTILEMDPTLWTLYPRGSILVSVLGVLLVVLTILLAVRNRRISRANAELRTSKLLVVRSLASVAEVRDNDTGLHIRRTQEYMRTICLSLREDERFTAVLTDEIIDQLFLASPLHDIGKVGIPDAILHKPGALDPEERAIMQQHTSIGRDLLERAQRETGGETPFFTLAIEIAQSHHEKWDGTGYPHGLAGEAIPLSARLMALADVYDALRSERPYKIKQTHDDVERFILAERGRHFDPAIVDAFARAKQRFIEVATRFGDTGA